MKAKKKQVVPKNHLLESINKLADAQHTSNEKMMREMNQVRQELQDMKNSLARLKQAPPRSTGERRGLLFGGRRNTAQVEAVPPPQKPAISIEDLLPLLPHLGDAIPQLKNPKVADSIKVLSNPAVISLIQQFLANGGLNMIKKPIQQVSRQERRGFFR
ncbi:hypothetical protein E8L90_20690 [Brevibacillus antibioticus]|uniref:Uncharacterized protein n=1 Tax=Brevibacillus antibioticus TaxID=2570228 RepID=A0A4U2YA82_9BACL|nr:hypothetical protein [Brevibacillus antibioticus]TKI57657.1 hypothetical protein E8L90_20690 [Brevibacillus antibioticus]